ncbi:hypothetical protein BDV18DRAFT_155930 [Aspergillus unguis]
MPRRDPWKEEEKNRLMRLREAHSDLSWKEFHELNFFPGRSGRSCYHQWTEIVRLRHEAKFGAVNGSSDNEGGGCVADNDGVNMDVNETDSDAGDIGADGVTVPVSTGYLSLCPAQALQLLIFVMGIQLGSVRSTTDMNPETEEIDEDAAQFNPDSGDESEEIPLRTVSARTNQTARMRLPSTASNNSNQPEPEETFRRGSRVNAPIIPITIEASATANISPATQDNITVGMKRQQPPGTGIRRRDCTVRPKRRSLRRHTPSRLATDPSTIASPITRTIRNSATQSNAVQDSRGQSPNDRPAPTKPPKRIKIVRQPVEETISINHNSTTNDSTAAASNPEAYQTPTTAQQPNSPISLSGQFQLSLSEHGTEVADLQTTTHNNADVPLASLLPSLEEQITAKRTTLHQQMEALVQEDNEHKAHLQKIRAIRSKMDRQQDLTLLDCFDVLALLNSADPKPSGFGED